MASASNIEWTDASWNPIVGCSIVSPGCTNCYAMKMAARINKMTLSSHYEGLTKKVNGNVVWTGKVALAPDYIFTAPLRWKKPRRIFVNSMGDLFHESIPDEWIDRVFAVMALCPQHTFQVLTKRAERMRAYLSRHDAAGRWVVAAVEISGRPHREIATPELAVEWSRGGLPNCWLGVSAERQQEADERIPLLLQTPAAIRFVSLEPLLGPIDLTKVQAPSSDNPARSFTKWDALRGYSKTDHPVFGGGGVAPGKLDWVIVGGESGPKARPMHPDWARSLQRQCEAAGVAFFFKQWGEHCPGAYSDKPEEHGEIPAGKTPSPPIIFQNGATYDSRGVIDAEGKRRALGPLTVFDGAAINGHRQVAYRVGKKAAGRLLDGKEWNGMPEGRT